MLQIFKTTLGPIHEYDPSITHGAKNPWLKSLHVKKGLLRICRSAYWPGMCILYEDVVLRRFGQVVPLARTLRSYSGNRGVAELIRSIRMDSCPVWAPCTDVIEEDLTYILERCTALRSFSYHPHPNFPLLPSPSGRDDEEEFEFFNPTWFLDAPPNHARPLLGERLASGLRNLDLSVPLTEATFPSLLRFLAGSPQLESLTLSSVSEHIPRWDVIALSSAVIGDLKLPQLRELCIFYGKSEHYSAYNNHLLSWQIPRLARLTILIDRVDPLDLIRRFGSQLTYLHVYPLATDMHSDNGKIYESLIKHVFELCPAVEHVVVPQPHRTSQDWQHLKLHVRSATLKYLDIWYHATSDLDIPYPPVANLQQSAILDAGSHTSSLLGVRLLFPANAYDVRGSVRNPDWPAICSPALVPQGSPGARFHRFAKTWVMQTAVMLLPLGLIGSSHLDGTLSLLNEFNSAVEEEAEELSQYVTSRSDRQRAGEELSEDEDSDHTVDTDESEGEDEDDTAGPGAKQLDREIILESFSRSRDTEAYRHVAIWDFEDDL